MKSSVPTIAFVLLFVNVSISKKAACSEDHNRCLSTQAESGLRSNGIDYTLQRDCKQDEKSRTFCPHHSFCFLGSCQCHPGYSFPTCTEKSKPANVWFTKCSTLESDNTFDVNYSLEDIGGEYSKTGSTCPSIEKSCAYLCFSHEAYGVAVVPTSLWKASQKAEADLWKDVSRWSTTSDSNDRAIEHWKAFDHLKCLQNEMDFGHTIEVGAGPWTQLKGLLYIRPDISVKKITIWEPSAKRYMAEVESCSYKNGVSMLKWDGSGHHPFPLQVISDGGEQLLDPIMIEKFDTLVSINVIEHVQDAFKYLTGLYLALKQGGLLIFHDRYYRDGNIVDGDVMHPVRIKRRVLDHFLTGFDIIFNNCSANYAGRTGERGYYVIARKKQKK